MTKGAPRDDEAPTTREGEQREARNKAHEDRRERSLEARAPARQPPRAVDHRVEQPRVLASGSRDVGGEDPSLCEIPRRVKADDEPEAPGDDVAGAEQDSRFEADRESSPPPGFGVEEVGRAEQRGGESERPPGAEAVLEEAEQTRAEGDLLADRGEDRLPGAHRDERVSVDAYDPIGVGRGPREGDNAFRASPLKRRPGAGGD